MIPVDESVINKVDLTIYKTDINKDKRYKELMQTQLKWCRQNSDVIINRANKVYKLVTETPEKNKNLTRRCCDLKKLEQVLEKYLNKQ